MRNRFRPKRTQFDYLHMSRLVGELRLAVAEYLGGRTDLSVLDVGCGHKTYLPLFQGMVSSYIGVDINPSSMLDVLSSAESLPIRNESFDASICTQVLEHIPDPEAAVDEVLRVLKPGGVFFLSTHGIWPVHDDKGDYWRWTDQGLRMLLRHFKDIYVYENGGAALTFFQLVSYGFDMFLPNRLSKPFIFVTNLLGDFFDKFVRKRRLIINYVVVAKKDYGE